MAEARLTTKRGEVFVLSDDNIQTSVPPSTVTIKDVIASVSKLQANVNSKLTEIINEEKEKAGNMIHKNAKSDEDGDDFEDDSDDDDDDDEKDKIDDRPPLKKKK